MEAFFKVNNVRDEEKKISYLTLSLNHRLISIKQPMLDLQTVFDVHKTDYNVYVQALTVELSWTYGECLLCVPELLLSWSEYPTQGIKGL